MAKKSNKVVRSNEPIIEVKFSKSKISKAVDAEIKTERSRLNQSAKNEILKKKITSNGRITSFSKQQLKKIKNKISLKGNEAASNYTESNESQAIEKIRSYVLHLIDEESKKPKKPTKKTNSRSARKTRK